MAGRIVLVFGVLVWCQLIAARAETSVDYDVTCSSDTMRVALTLNSSDTLVYLENLKDYPDCKPHQEGGKTVFVLSLENIYLCGMFKMENKMTGDRIYYHRIIVDPPNEGKEVVLVTCFVSGHGRHKPFFRDNRTKRNTLPENFFEPEFINITDYVEERAPVPYLNLAIRQHGRVVDTALNVQPGTPLEMIVYLDDKSAPTYGLLTSYMKVTDNTSNHEEVIIMNGCSIDPYIFGHFETADNGDTLSAKFRAFKFPESNYVHFVGTVNICLQQCKGVPCGNGQLGYGRRKREVPPELPPDPNKIFEVEMTAFIKVQPEHKYSEPKKGTSMTGEFDDLNKNVDNKVANDNSLLPLTQSDEPTNPDTSGTEKTRSSATGLLVLITSTALLCRRRPH